MPLGARFLLRIFNHHQFLSLLLNSSFSLNFVLRFLIEPIPDALSPFILITISSSGPRPASRATRTPYWLEILIATGQFSTVIIRNF